MKKILSLVLAIAIIICAVPLGAFTFTASAASVTSGTTGDCTWRLEGTVLTISGNGEMGNNSHGEFGCSLPWGSGITVVNIEYGVTSIGSHAFCGCRKLTSITISESVTSIGSGAFYDCTSLKSVTIGNNVTSIGDIAFSGCAGLTSITIPDNVTSIGANAFNDCCSLTSVTIPNSVTSIDSYAFRDCTSLKNVTIGSNVTSIGNGVFENTAYYNDENNWQDNALYIGNYLIGVETNFFGNYTIKDDTKVIGGSAFYGCRKLTSITIPDSVISIGYSAFSGCTGLTSITIPDSVTSIGDSAFSGCTGLTSITIPDSVTSIGTHVFWKTAYYNDENNWKDNALYIGNYLIEAKNNILGDYVIKDNTRIIGHRAFFECSSLTGITIPDSVISIGDGAFEFCSGLTSITIPDSVTSIGHSAFYDCRKLTSITIPDSVTRIDRSTFEFCSGLTSITIPDSVTSIGDWAFSGCTGLTSITIPDSVTSIGDSAFSGCAGLTSITIPDSVTSIGGFSGCTGLTSITIPDSVTSIGDWAFSGCTGLTGITIPDNVISIGDYAFRYCNSLKSVTIGNNVASMDSYAFDGCISLASITIPDSVTSIDYGAFRDCKSLESVYYRGSASEKTQILIFDDNTYLTYATWYYDSCIGKATHIYDNTCDTDCNECGAVRSITHTYSNNCDAVCNVCKETRQVPDHIYDHIYDDTCNECGEVREATPLEWEISVTKTGVYTLKPNSKYTGSFSTNKIIVLDKNGNEVKFNESKGGFPLVADQDYTVKFNYDCIDDINGTVTWTKTKKADTIFPDTSADGWYNDAVTYAVGAGIIGGYGNGKFGTSDSIQRQDFLVILARLDGVDLTKYGNKKSAFPDVSEGSYYEAAVNWGSEKGIVTGYDNGKFGVGDKVTREQLVTFLYRYAKYKGLNVNCTTAQKNKVKNTYSDYKNVSAFAQDAIIWAVTKGVINGKTPTTIVPQGNAQRCEVAQIMYNIFKNNIF